VRYSLAEATSKENSSQELSTGSTPTTVGLRPSLLKRGLSGLSRVLTTIRMLLCKKNIPKHENEGGKLTHLQGIGRSKFIIPPLSSVSSIIFSLCGSSDDLTPHPLP
jgi:hypothetical protein